MALFLKAIRHVDLKWLAGKGSKSDTRRPLSGKKMDWEQSPRFTTADLGFVQSLPSGFFYLNEQYSSLMLTTGGLLWTSLSFIDAVPSSTNGAVWIRVPRGLEKTIFSSKRTTYRPSKQNYILQKDNLIWSHNFAKEAEKKLSLENFNRTLMTPLVKKELIKLELLLE